MIIWSPVVSTGRSQEALGNIILLHLLLSPNRGLQSYHPPVTQKYEKECLFSHSLRDGRASSLL